MPDVLADLRRTDRYPMSSKYDPDWVLSLDMGPHPLWQLEDLLDDVPLVPGSRVLDLGCGRGATSVFLAREFDVEVVAADLWVPRAELAADLHAAGVGDRVTAVNADARDLPFGDGEFDAIVSVDAFEYFGTDVRFLPGLLRLLKPGGRVGMTTPALRRDPYDEPPPGYVVDLAGWEAAAWHSPEWWATHWNLTGLVEDVTARMQPDGRENWLLWARASGEEDDGAVTRALRQDADGLIGFALVSARKRAAPS